MKRLGFDLILLGDSASGKDTQALSLAKTYHLKLARSGEFLRRYRARQYVQGAPAPSRLIIPFLRDSFKKLGARDLLFVGAARLEPEAEYLVKQLNRRHRDFFAVYLRLPAREVIKRSQKRAQRPEDTDLKLIRQRLKYYKTQVGRTVKFYQRLHKLKFVDANQSIKEVNQDLLRIIHDYQKRARA